MEQIFRRKTVRARILGNPLGPVLQQYIDYLVGRGYLPGTTRRYVFSVEHFGNWLGVRAVSHALVARFISHHLSVRRCKKPAVRGVSNVPAALHRLLEMLGVERPRSITPPAHPVVDRLLREYEGHLLAAAGLAESTTRKRLVHARNLLDHFEVQRSSQFKSWLATDLAEYVAGTARKLKPATGSQLSSSARKFLRFLLFKGLVRRDLSPAIPSFANWRLARLPPVVDRKDLETLLNAVDASTPIGMRDRAALLCMIDLGLRASDVAALTTAGIDLPGNALRLGHAKERRVGELPMTRRLALALREYLRRGRPRSDSPELFVTHRAPIGQALTPARICGIVVRHAARAGLAASIRGTHVIRHSVASSLINAGASIKDIADLLGHRSIDTTAIYAKVDLQTLARVAMPWPGDRR